VYVGWSAGTATGPALRLSTRQGATTLAYAVERLTGADTGQTLGLVGVGLGRPIRRSWRVEALVLGGFNLYDKPFVAWLPALGARTGIEWAPRRRWLNGIQLSMTGLYDVTRREIAGEEVGGMSLLWTVSTGFALPTK
jgi:hypothetical protein